MERLCRDVSNKLLNVVVLSAQKYAGKESGCLVDPYQVAFCEKRCSKVAPKNKNFLSPSSFI